MEGRVLATYLDEISGPKFSTQGSSFGRFPITIDGFD